MLIQLNIPQSKRQQQQRIKADIAAYLAQGGRIQQLDIINYRGTKQDAARSMAKEPSQRRQRQKALYEARMQQLAKTPK